MKATLTRTEKFNSLDEAELITRTQNGDTEAFTPIVLMYRERIYKLIYPPHRLSKRRVYVMRHADSRR